MIWVSIVEAIVISFFVGYGCFVWGKNKAQDDQFKKEQQEKAEKSKQAFQERERLNKQYESMTKENEKEIKLIKSVITNHKIKLNKIQIKGIQFMLKEKYGIVPVEPDEIYNFIKQNVLNIKEQE